MGFSVSHTELREALAEVDRVFRSGGIEYWLDSGLLLLAEGARGPSVSAMRAAVCIYQDDLPRALALKGLFEAPYRQSPMSRLWPLDTVLPGLGSVFPGSSSLWVRGPSIHHQIGNFFMASAPGHPFWLHVLDLVKEREKVPVRTNYDVIYTTGPDALTEAVERASSRFPDVAVVEQKTAERFLSHRCSGHWRG